MRPRPRRHPEGGSGGRHPIQSARSRHVLHDPCLCPSLAPPPAPLAPPLSSHTLTPEQASLLERHRGICHTLVFQGSCPRPGCKFEHRVLPPGEAALFAEAVRSRKSPSVLSGSDSPASQASSGTDIATAPPRMCQSMLTGVLCPFGDRCFKLHAVTPADIKRARDARNEVRARKGKGKGDGKNGGKDGGQGLPAVDTAAAIPRGFTIVGHSGRPERPMGFGVLS